MNMNTPFSRKYFSLSVCAVILAAGITTHCTTNPYTDRKQFVAVPQSQAVQMGQQAYQQVLSDPKVQLAQSPEIKAAVESVAKRIIEAAKQSEYAEKAKEFEWEVAVIQDDQMANAFVLPGGKIAVYTGILPIAQNYSGLAAIMGHEVVHALARHASERMSQKFLTQAGLTAAAVGIGASGAGPLVSEATMAALGMGANVGILLPYSRTHESEADSIGLILSASAGYNPREAVEVWKRMQQRGQGQPPEFLSTHPSHETRIERLQEAMPEALKIYRNVEHAPQGPLPPVR